ncbi:MAG: OmpA family protein [Sandaracinaceae bacterium]|nr:OmpA family protein [Sandaracinaceae bacterium]
MKSPRIAATIALSTLLLVACGSSSSAEDERAGNAGAGTAQTNRGTGTAGGENLASTSGCAIESVYFAYDSNTLDARARTTLDGNARCLSQRSGRARVNGMTDPRGTEEYNFALGEQRARSVTRYLAMTGVDESRLTTRSLGEEVASGTDETGWARDRRADIEVY